MMTQDKQTYQNEDKGIWLNLFFAVVIGILTSFGLFKILYYVFPVGYLTGPGVFLYAFMLNFIDGLVIGLVARPSMRLLAAGITIIFGFIDTITHATIIGLFFALVFGIPVKFLGVFVGGGMVSSLPRQSLSDKSVVLLGLSLVLFILGSLSYFLTVKDGYLILKYTTPQERSYNKARPPPLFFFDSRQRVIGLYLAGDRLAKQGKIDKAKYAFQKAKQAAKNSDRLHESYVSVTSDGISPGVLLCLLYQLGGSLEEAIDCGERVRDPYGKVEVFESVARATSNFNQAQARELLLRAIKITDEMPFDEKEKSLMGIFTTQVNFHWKADALRTLEHLQKPENKVRAQEYLEAECSAWPCDKLME